MIDKKQHCEVCQRIKAIKEGTNPYFVTELETGYVVLGDSQFYQGYTLFLSKKHATELHFLPSKFAIKYLQELMLVGKAVWNGFKPEKLNYELLGNSESHLHWHIFPRHKDDPKRKYPVWCYNENVRNAKKYFPNPKKLAYFKNKLLEQINELYSNKR